jgi:hypothetical protein
MVVELEVSTSLIQKLAIGRSIELVPYIEYSEKLVPLKIHLNVILPYPIESSM